MALIISIATKLDERGIRKAQHSFKKLTGSMKGMLGGALGALGIGLTVRELINMAEAANTDAKSAKLLSDQLHRMAKATKLQSDSAEAFIQTLSLQTGIIDDQLRPTLIELAASTKDVEKAQKLLSAVLDISAGRGKSVEAVQKAVTKSYSGNITVLQRMFPEMKKFADAYKATKGHALTFAESIDLGRKMIKKMAEDNKGQAAQMATPFDKMQVAIDNLKENIGGALMPVIEKIIPKIQDMVKAFGTPNSPEAKSLKEIGDSLVLAFNAFDNLSKRITGDTALVASLNSIRNLLLGTAFILESIGATWDMITGKKFDPSKYPLLNANKTAGAKAASFMLNPVANTWLEAGKSGAKAMQSGNKSMPTGGATINVYGVVGDKVAVGKAVKEAMKAYESRNN